MMDWNAIRQQYNETTVDIKRLKQYAKKVVSQTKKPFDTCYQDCWVLRHVTHTLVDKFSGGGGSETELTNKYYLLRKDGVLIVRSTLDKRFEYVTKYFSKRQTDISNEKGFIPEHEMNETDILSFDFELKYYNFKNGSIYSEGNDPTFLDFNRCKLLVHKKGVGLSKALKKILDYKN